MDVVEIDAARAAQRLTFDGRNRYPIWSSDGRSVFFQSDRDGSRAIFRQRADGSSSGRAADDPRNRRRARPARGVIRRFAPALFIVQGQAVDAVDPQPPRPPRDGIWQCALRGAYPREPSRQTANGSSTRRGSLAIPARCSCSRFPNRRRVLCWRVGRHPYWTVKGDAIDLSIPGRHQSADSVQRQPESGIRRPRTVHADWAHRSQSGHLPAQFRRDAERNAFHRHSHGRV